MSAHDPAEGSAAAVPPHLRDVRSAAKWQNTGNRQDDFFRAFLSQLLLHDRRFRGEGESMRTRNKETNVRFIAVTGVLSAAAFVLMLIEIPVPMLIPPFIKFDFSDLPALIGAFAMGPLCGILIEFIKNLLHTFVSGSFGVGELSNFMLGAVFVGIAGLIYGLNRTKKGAVTGSLVGALAMALFSLPSNYFIVKSIGESLLLFNVPFTFVKGMIDVAVTFLVYKKLSPILKGTAGHRAGQAV